MFYLPFFLTGLSVVLLPFALILSAFYFVSALKGLPKAKETIDLTRFFHYGLALITYIVVLASLVALSQSGALLYLGVKSYSGYSNDLDTGFSTKEFVKRDLADALSILLVSTLLHFYSYWKLKSLRQKEEDNPHDLLLHKIYFVGVISYLVFLFITTSGALFSSYLDFLTGNTTFTLDNLRKVSVEVWSKHGLGLVLSLGLGIRNMGKLRRLGENI